MDDSKNNNQVMLIGKIITPCSFDYHAYGDDFYQTELAADRLSGYTDRIPLVMSGCQIDTQRIYTGQNIRVNGQFRSRNSNHHMELFVYAQELQFLDMPIQPNTCTDNNTVWLDGYICKQPGWRRTPLGRGIADLLVAVNRQFGNSDYIPCICWGRNATRAADLKVGSHVQLRGRIQSREYQKRVGGYIERRTAYEVSVSRLEYLP